uniref:BZIP domain-containing protein n=1 Tax=Heterosigma akashiwo TaxID=2829 RepID=A0A7S3UTR3_HETAK
MWNFQQTASPFNPGIRQKDGVPILVTSDANGLPPENPGGIIDAPAPMFVTQGAPSAIGQADAFDFKQFTSSRSSNLPSAKKRQRNDGKDKTKRANKDDSSAREDSEEQEEDEDVKDDEDEDDEDSSKNYVAIQEKNRENARNTRLRKKVYVEKLKQTVAQLGAEREIKEAEKRTKKKKEEEEIALKFQAVQTFFYYRATGELDRGRWAALLEEDVVLTQPITPYRSFDAREVVQNMREVRGVDGVVKDTASLGVLTKSLGRPGNSEDVALRYYVAKEDTVVVGRALMCRWMLRTVNAVQCGGLCELYNHGMLRAEFGEPSSDGPPGGGCKLRRLRLVFDVMSFMQQLQRCSGKACFHIVPNTVAMAKQGADEARLVCAAQPPYAVAHVNRAWQALFGQGLEEVYGRPLAFLDGGGPGAAESVVARADDQFPLQRACSFLARANSRYRMAFPARVCAYPLAADPPRRPGHYLLVFHEVK